MIPSAVGIWVFVFPLLQTRLLPVNKFLVTWDSLFSKAVESYQAWQQFLCLLSLCNLSILPLAFFNERQVTRSVRRYLRFECHNHFLAFGLLLCSILFFFPLRKSVFIFLFIYLVCFVKFVLCFVIIFCSTGHKPMGGQIGNLG